MRWKVHSKMKRQVRLLTLRRQLRQESRTPAERRRQADLIALARAVEGAAR